MVSAGTEEVPFGTCRRAPSRASVEVTRTRARRETRMSGHRRLAALAASVALLVGTAPTAADAAVREPAAKEPVKVATYNLYIGGDVGTLLAPGIDTVPEFIAAATALWQNVVATNF